MAILRAPRAADIDFVAERMRAADVAECVACGQPDVRAALAAGLRTSVLSWTATVDNEPVAILGVSPQGTLLGDIGVPWMLGTEGVSRHRRAFMQVSSGYIAQMLGAFSHLLNFVHAENAAAVRWLKRTGFSLDEPAPYGPHGEPFHRFEMHAHDGLVHLLARKGRGPASRDAGEPRADPPV